MWNICGHSLSAGQKLETEIMVDAHYGMPSTLICGKEAGKTLLVTAGIHGSEFPGTAATIKLAREIVPENLKGNLILVHCVNISGFWEKTNGIVPEDRANLNGNYPGKADGTMGERIADYFVRNVFPYVDFILDMHSGGMAEPLTPCLFFPKAARVRAESLAAAKAMNFPFIIESTATTGEYSYAANHMDIPGLLVERGHSGYCRDKWVTEYLKDLRLLLKHRGMYGFNGRASCSKKVYTRTIYLSSDASGLWHPEIREGQQVFKGDILGRIEDFRGNQTAEYRAQENGTVFYYSAGLSVRRGDHLVAYGLESSVE